VADEIDGEDLMARLPEPGSVTPPRDSRDWRDGADAVERRGGVAEADRLPQRSDLFTAYARGGVSLAPAEAYHDATLARRSSALPASAASPRRSGQGAGRADRQRVPFISTYTHGVNGSSTPRDLEAALQLVHLHFTRRTTTRGVRADASGVSRQAREPGAESGAVFGERVRRLNTSDHYTARQLRARRSAAISMPSG
jgi:hypothetical protein